MDRDARHRGRDGARRDRDGEPGRSRRRPGHLCRRPRVVEAEDHDAKVARSAHDWATGAGPVGVVGTAIQATPDAGARHVLGLAFDPAATAADLVPWVSHGTPGFDPEPTRTTWPDIRPAGSP